MSGPDYETNDIEEARHFEQDNTYPEEPDTDLASEMEDYDG